MPITWHGVVSDPADNGSQVNTQLTLTPPGSMQAGDLVFVNCYQRGTATFSVGNAGGQSWNTLSRQTQSTTTAAQAFWCRFNGTWSTNPRFDFSAGTNTNAVMIVFRASDTAKLWAVDGSEDAGTFNAPATPFAVTLTGRTTGQASNVTIASWVTADDNTWGAVSGTNWVTTNLAAQYRNTAGQDMSSAYAYQIQTSAGATNNVTRAQATLGGDAGVRRLVTFYEYDAPSTVLKDMIGRGIIPAPR